MISIVIPLYNKEKSISKTLLSVMNQTYTDYEIVIVNDGSTDNSLMVAKQCLESFNNVNIISKANGGVSSARNTGILAAKGEYIAFLDGDDIWKPNYLETLAKLISDFPDCTIWGLGYGQLINGIETAQPNLSFKNYRGIIDNVWTNYPGIWTGSSSSSKASLVEAGLFDERITHGEDIDMWWRLLLNGKGAIDYTNTYAFYNQDSENRAMKNKIPFEKHLPFYIEKYDSHRKSNVEFRRFFDKECLYRLFPYATMPKYRKDVQRVLSQIDFSLQKKSMKYRFFIPRLYRFYSKVVGR